MKRKDEHITLAKDRRSQAQSNAFDAYLLEPKALPELSLNDIDTTARFLRWKCRFPLVISSMTGGAKDAAKINTRLAKAAALWHLPFCTGSIGPLLKNDSCIKDYSLRSILKTAPFFLNVGVHVLQENDSRKKVLHYAKMLKADGIIVHLNVLQELIQPEGERNFKGHIESLKKLRSIYAGYIIAKEVGVGIDRVSAEILQKIGIDVIDVGGHGGTSWAWIEGERGNDHRGNVFKDFGIPTPFLLEDLRKLKVPVVGSGGVRSGLDIARCIALGASMAGMAHILLSAALEDRVMEQIEALSRELKTTMMASGAKNLQSLRKTRLRRLMALQEIET